MTAPPELSGHLETLAGARIFFSHQSVGADVLDGLAALARQANVGLDIVSWEPLRPQEGRGLLHALGGENGRPDSKLAFFADALDALAGSPPEVALMKFCYADFTPETDVAALFARYRAALERLADRHPQVAFVPATVPLTKRPAGVKARLSRLVGGQVWQDAANARRHDFNERLREMFADRVLFDIARAESARPGGDGAASPGSASGRPALCASYAADDGHLNVEGRRRVAPELARALASAVAVRRAWS